MAEALKHCSELQVVNITGRRVCHCCLQPRQALTLTPSPASTQTISWTVLAVLPSWLLH